jgi:hypothetical protein
MPDDDPQPQGKPWEKYQKAPSAAGKPWERYGVTPPAPEGGPRPSTAGEAVSEFGRGLGSIDVGAGISDLARGAKEVVTEGGSLLGNFFKSLLPTREGAKAGGEVVRKAGDIGAFASGGFAGPQEMPPSAREFSRQTELPPRPTAPLTAHQQATQEFTQAGVRPSVPAMRGTRPFGGRVPGSPVAGALQRTEQDIAASAERSADAYGSPQDPYSAGNIIKNAMSRYAADKTQAGTDYKEFDRLMHGAKPIPVTNTVKALSDLEGKFPNAPEIEHVFANPKLRTMSQSLRPRTETIPARTSPIMGPTGQPIITSPAQTMQRGGVLSYGELKELRTRVGYLIENPSVLGTEHIPRADLRRVYGALTNDLQAGARSVGPAAVKALNRATISYGVRMRTMERLEPLLKPDAPENVFQRINQAASSTGSADAQLLSAAKKSMKPEEWNEVSSAIIRRLGRPTTPKAIRDPAADPEFSLKTFTDNWHKISGRAKDQLFGEDSVGSPRAGLELLQRVARTQGAVQRGSTLERAGIAAGFTGAVVEGVISGLMTGRIPWAETLGLGSAYGMSKLLMSPGFTQWLYRVPEVAQSARSTDAAIVQASGLLQKALQGQLPPPQPQPPPPEKPPTPAQRQKQSDLSWDRHNANRRGDLTEYQRLA